MTKCVSTLHARSLAIFATAALLMALPASSLGSDPATDQYAPSTPGGGGDVPVNENETDFGGVTNGGSGSGSGSGGGDSAPAATAPPATTSPTASPTTAAGTGDGGSGGKDGKRDSGAERTVGGFAAQAEKDRQAVANASAGSSDLVRSESDDDGGLGPFLWVALALTLAGALTIGAARRREGGHPA